MSLCVLGNSHIAALKVANGLADATFFGAPKLTMRSLEIEAGLLRSRRAEVTESLKRTSGGHGAIDPGRYSRFVVVGLNYGLVNLIRLYRHYRSDQHIGRRGAAYLVSDLCFHETAVARLRHGPAARIIRLLKQITDKPICLVPQPMPSETVLQAGPPRSEVWQSAQQDADSLAALFHEEAQRFAAASGITLLAQPAATLATPILTRAEFSEGSVRMINGFRGHHSQSDVVHMNPVFGRIVAGQIEQWSSGLSTSKAA